jgi:hypothetical protein
MLECRVIAKNDMQGNPPREIAVLYMELKNVSDKAIVFRSTYIPPLAFMKREIRGPDGILSTDNRSEILAPNSFEPRDYTLKAGETWKEPFGSVGEAGPGVYRIKALFEYEKLKVASPVVTVELRDVKAK